MAELISRAGPNPYVKLETYHAWRLGEYMRMPATTNPKHNNLATFMLTSYAKDFIEQASRVDIDGPQYRPVVYIYTSGPGNGKTEAINATQQLLERNAFFLTHPSDGVPKLADEIRVATWDYRYSLLGAIDAGKMERNRDRYHTQGDYDNVLNPQLWSDIDALLDWRPDGKRANHILLLEIPRTTGWERTGAVIQKLAELDREGKIHARLVFSQGSPIVRQLGLLKRRATQATLEMDLEDAKYVFWEWGMTKPKSNTEKRRRAGDGAPPAQLKYWNDDIDRGITAWAVENNIVFPFLRGPEGGRVFYDPEEFKRVILTPEWYSLQRREAEINDIVYASGLFGKAALDPLMFRDLAIGMEANQTLGELFGENMIVVYDAPPLQHLIDPKRREKVRIELKPALRIVRGIHRLHGQTIGEYTSQVYDHDENWLDYPVEDDLAA